MDYWRLTLLPGLLSALVLGSSPETSRSISKRDTTDDLKIVCYYSNWAVYRPGLSKFTPQNINPYLCTHLIYAFASLSADYELDPFDPYNDMEQGNYKSFVGLKAYNSNLKTMVAVGGWNEGSKRFSRMVELPEHREKFVKSALRFVRENGFDGLDLDWEYPAFREGGNDTDKKGYAQLIRELRLAIDEERVPPGKDRLLLSIAVPATKEYIDRGFDVPVIAKNVDFMNLLTYDYHTAYEPETNHHAPLFPFPESNELDPRRKLNVEWTVDYYIQLGAPKNKIIVGIPTYGRSYVLADQNFTGLDAAALGPGEEGAATREKGYLAFYEVCQRVKEDEWEIETPYPQLMGPYAYNKDQWVGFDDEEMVALKARFIIDRELGGAMVWTLDNDDFRGLCTGEQSPLINSLRNALLSNVIEGSSSQRSVARSAGPETASAPLDRVVFDDEASTVDEVSSNPRRRTTLRKLVQNRQSSRRANPGSRNNNVFTTPSPPTTPDPGPAFECRKEGFFNNPRDCKKYFWCLDSGPANLGIVAHAFTCPSGLYFNSATESCDYTENVVCRTRSAEARQSTKPPASRLARPRGRITTTTTTTTTQAPITTTTEIDYDTDIETDDFDDVVTKEIPSPQNASEGENVAELIRLLQAIGGVEKLQSLLGSQIRNPYDPKPTVESSFETPKPDITLKIEDVRSPADSYAIYDTSPYQTAPSIENNNYDSKDAFKPVTTSPASEATFAPEEPLLGQQVPRRPQFEPTEQDLFHYVQPERVSSSTADESGVNNDYANIDLIGDDKNVGDDYPFEYHTPSRGYDEFPEKIDAPSSQRDENRYEDENRSTLPQHVTERKTTSPPPPSPTITPYAPVSVPTVTEHTPLQKETKLPGEAYRTPIRVQVGRVVRIQNGVEGNNIVRRRMRVRVRPAATNVRSNESERVARVVGRLPEGRRIAVADIPQRPVFQGNGGDRVAVRRRPLHSNGFENASLPGVRLVARSRRPQEIADSPAKVEPHVDYVPDRIGHHSDRVTSSTEYPTVIVTDASTTQPIKPSSELGYQPPIYQPVSPKAVYEAEDENGDDYDDYDDIPGSELDDYESHSTQSNVPTEPSTTTTTTTTTTPRPRTTTARLKTTRSRTTAQTTSQPTTVRRTASSRQTTKTKRPQQKATTPIPRTTIAEEEEEEEESGNTVVVRSDSDVDCFRRGVFIHPDECSKFIVCAPASRSGQGLRGRVLNCPANQIYLEDIGRCMKGDRSNCVKLKK